ncbi:MAG TPA: 3-oxoadipate enol-lactonase [Steroidobacteraceae bacterium]|jgi:3-oxoadipate enol-lactonase|nr:3-oxoadipate enol-lactonase [Steroidobacteraceae bacterium]
MMSEAEIKSVYSNGANLRVEHTRRPGAPVLLLLHALGVSSEMWDEQMKALARHYEVIRFDMRGHGKSTIGGPPEASIELLASDALAVMDACGIGRAHLCGLSLGGMVAMHIAARSPERALKVTLCNTTPYMPPRETWEARIQTALAQGMEPLIEGILGRWFTAAYRQAHPEKVDKIRSLLRQASPAGFAACCAAIRDMDERESIRRISAETLVIGGSKDIGTTPAQAQLIASSIDGARLVILEAAHLSNIECGEEFTAALISFLSGA